MDTREKIYNKCYDVDPNFALDVDELIDEVIDEERYKYVENIKKLKEDHVNHLKQYDKLLDDYEIEKKNSEGQKIIRIALPFVRQFLNEKFRSLWRNLTQNEQDKYDECDVSFVKRQNVLDDDGVKYAVLVKYNICNGVSKKICDYYLMLNNEFHPKIKPENKIIHEWILKLKKVNKNLLLDINLDEDKLNEIDDLCK